MSCAHKAAPRTIVKKESPSWYTSWLPITSGKSSRFFPSPNQKGMLYTVDDEGILSISKTDKDGDSFFIKENFDTFMARSSQDGKTVAYVSRQNDAKGNIVVMKEGTLTWENMEIKRPGQDLEPEFSADGKLLLFTSIVYGKKPEILVYRVDELSQPIFSFEGSQGAFHPFGSQIAFQNLGNI